MPKRTSAYRPWLLKQLGDPIIAKNYVNAVIEDSPDLLLKALRNVAEARGMENMALTARELYDYRDPTAAEMKLTRAGHHLLSRIRRLRSFSGGTVGQERPIYEALEIIWQAKREVKEQIKARNAAKFAKWRPK